MDAIPEAGRCEWPSCCCLRWRETGVSDRPTLADGLQLVFYCWKISSYLAVMVEGLYYWWLQVSVYLGFCSAVCHSVELLPLHDFDDFTRLCASKPGLFSLSILFYAFAIAFFRCIPFQILFETNLVNDDLICFFRSDLCLLLDTYSFCC